MKSSRWPVVAQLLASLLVVSVVVCTSRAEDLDAQRPQLVAQVGHMGAISRVTFAPDGRTVLTAGGLMDPTPRLWDVATGRLIRPFVGHEKGILDIACSPDGRLVSSAGWDKSARLWDTATGQEVFRLVGHTREVRSITFFPDGRTVATGSTDKTVRLWDTATGRERLPRYEANEDIGNVTVSPDGKMILIGASVNGVGVLWNPSDGQVIRRLGGAGDNSAFEEVRFAPDGRTILSWGRNHEPSIWNVETGVRVHTLTAVAAYSVDSAAFTPDGQRVLTADNGTLWEAATGKSLRQYDFGGFRANSVAFAPDGLTFVTGCSQNQDGSARLWDTVTGKERVRFAGRVAPLVAVEPGKEPDTIRVQAQVQYQASRQPDGTVGPGRFIATQDVITWDARKGSGAARGTAQPKKLKIMGMAILPDRTRYLIRDGDGQKSPIDPKTGRPLPVVRFAFTPDLVVISPNGRQVLTNGGGVGKGGAILWDLETGGEVREFKTSTQEGGGGAGVYAFSPDGRWILTGNSDETARILDVETGRELKKFEGHTDSVVSVAASADSRLLLTGGQDKTIRLWDTSTGREVWHAKAHQNVVTSVAFGADGQTALTASDDGTTGVWDLETGQELARLVSFLDGTWAILTPDGQFDTDRPGDLADLNWVFPDDPFRPLPLEIFLRDNFEPRLLPRALARKASKSLRPLSGINRQQPDVRFFRVEPADTPDHVAITVAVVATEGRFLLRGREAVMKTDVYDLRLFRDGQLVGRWPEPRDGGLEEFEPDPAKPADMGKWRDLNRVKSDGQRVQAGADGKLTVTFPVRLPSRSVPGQAEFTAYAFNEDRVKSETARFTYQAPAKPATTKPRAYLVCMGVSACETSAWKLAFAAKDAELTAAALGQALKETGRYDVVPVVLTSQAAADGHPASTAATKGNLQAVLNLLTGKLVDPSVREQLPNSDQLQQATPNDLVLVMFSGHGYTDPRGSLYLIPYDVGSGLARVADAQSQCISSGELSAWLRGIDAGETMLVVDACHSAAAIEEPGFKPGPLGNRGLGQLAYDKGMRILAAAQGNELALESHKVKQGLLTYALVRDGLQQRRAAKDGTITLGGLLAYAAERVPTLYEEVVAGQVKDADGKAAHDVTIVKDAELVGELLNALPLAKQPIQRPELFDYAKTRPDVTLDKRK